ncbi:MAG: hypothetical protein NTNFB02_30000 [Nitrospira sp.]
MAARWYRSHTTEVQDGRSGACTLDLTKTYAVAEFMLNLLDMTNAPAKRDVEAYLQANFASSDGSYRIPVHQDFLQIRAETSTAEA